jgi:TctA family transporter
VTGVLDGLALGLGVALTPANALYCFLGCLIGTLIGVLPGLGPVATVAILLPVTYHLPPVAALIMLAGIYYGAQYGGSTTSILLKIPGESASVLTCLDGHMMARKGRAGAALSIAAGGSFIAGTVATVVVAFGASALAEVALSFGAAEYFMLMVVGLALAMLLSQSSPAKSLLMILLGLLLGTVGADVNSGVYRFAFGRDELVEGLGFVPMAMGLFGLPEMIQTLAESHKTGSAGRIAAIGSLFPDSREIRRALPACLRGTAIGSIIGVLPGGGAVLSAFASYVLEKRLSPRPEEFGQGAVEGLAGPESANNAAAQTGFIPLLTLGIPPNAGLAIMIGAFLLHGVVPGPEVVAKQPELFWSVIASMWVGNLMLVVINLPLIGLWVSLLRIPFRVLYPCVLVVCVIGVYSVNNNYFDIVLMALFCVLGHVLLARRYDPSPLLIAFVLGPMIEENFRRAMTLSRGDLGVFLSRPVSRILAIGLALALSALLVGFIRKARRAPAGAPDGGPPPGEAPGD